MIGECFICRTRFSYPNREWFARLVPLICSSHCFARYLTEALETTDPLDDARVQKFTDSDRSYRSQYEREFADWMRRQRIPHKYEPYSFTFKDKKRYVPDFFVSSGTFIEVKGLWSAEGKKKVIAFRNEFPYHPLLVVDLDFIRMLKKTERQK